MVTAYTTRAARKYLAFPGGLLITIFRNRKRDCLVTMGDNLNAAITRADAAKLIREVRRKVY
jgi:hypothetical protein